MKLIAAMAIGWGLVVMNWIMPLSTAQAQTMQRVVRIADGDTIVLDNAGKREKVRLVCIDAPELSQARWGEASKQYLHQLAPPGSLVSLRRVTTDRYGRTIAEVFLPDQRSANLLLVQAGLAAVYERYLDNCPNPSDYVQAERDAKQARRGFWGDPGFVLPWDYKRSNPRNR
jgi:micrococcal nuclease